GHRLPAAGGWRGRRAAGRLRRRRLSFPSWRPLGAAARGAAAHADVARPRAARAPAAELAQGGRRARARGRRELVSAAPRGAGRRRRGDTAVRWPRPSQLAGQAAAWALFMAVTGVFAQWPVYAPLPPGHGELKLSLAHLTERLEA